MTQPRKEQVKNLKTKFTRVDQVGTQTLGGTQVQLIQNTLASAAYDDLLGQSVTHAAGGADTPTPPVLYGGPGPYSGISPGDGFTVTLPGVNAGNPVSVVIGAPDLVSLGGGPVLTTSRAAAAINAALGLVGVSTPVAANQEGRLVLIGADGSGRTYGDASFVTATDVTPGILSIMGFAASPATANGTSAPRRGIVTVSKDGLGGYVALRAADQTPAVSLNSSLNFFPTNSGTVFGYTPQSPPGQPVFGRLLQFPGAALLGRHFLLSFFRQGLVRGQVVTASSNFAALGPADSVTFVVSDPTLGPSFSFPVAFTPAPTTVQNVIDIVNAAWNAQTLADTGYAAGQAAVRCGVSGAYSFSSVGESFFIAFQGTSPIHIQPDATVVSTTDLRDFIQAAIVAAGAVAAGTAVVVVEASGLEKVVIKSLVATGAGSHVDVFAGSPTGPAVPGRYMTTLDKIGLAPGHYRGSVIAELYGADEIALFCPSHAVGASITISGTAPVMAKLGIPATSVSRVTANGVERVPAPRVHALVPEVMEFGEVPDDSDTVAQQFLATDDVGNADPALGAANLGISALVGQDGKIKPDFIKKLFDVLSVGQLSLGSELTGTASDLAKARALTTYDASLGPVLLWEGTSILGNVGFRDRLYIMDAAGVMVRTTNAKFDGTQWTKDVEGFVASRITTGRGGSTHGVRPAAAASPWFDVAWEDRVVVDPGGVNPLLSLGLGITESPTSALVPRVEIATGDAVTTLVSETVIPGGPGVREYAVSDSAGSSSLYWTLNARIDDTGTFHKDVLGLPATMYTIGVGGVTFLFQQDANDTPWSSWDALPFFMNNDPTVPGGALNVFQAPVKANSVRNNTGVGAVSVGGSNITMTLSDTALGPRDMFIFDITSATSISSVNMAGLALSQGDSFEVVIHHRVAAAQVVTVGAWGVNVFWEDSSDPLLSDAVGWIDHYTFKNVGFNSVPGTRRLLGSVRRYSGIAIL